MKKQKEIKSLKTVKAQVIQPAISPKAARQVIGGHNPWADSDHGPIT